MPSKKRRRLQLSTIHPRNRYSGSPPDFRLLASLYPSFKPHVFYSRDGHPRIDWTDFNATRELTRVLLLHDHHVNWWIPDGQLCPTVPNRSNYIHWIEDLLSSELIPKNNIGCKVRGFDIGTGASCIYPLLGASLMGWSFVGSDVTDVALEWAERNVGNNLHISELIEIRRVENTEEKLPEKEAHDDQMVNCRSNKASNGLENGEDTMPLASLDVKVDRNQSYRGPPVLLGVVKIGENFDFCMCNPPFFENMEEAGLNPKTSCGGTPEEMVCPGGELAFITRIIEDSVVLKQNFRWYTSMVGRKANLKTLVSKLREVGATIVKTTDFVQGQTCRWGLAWSFVLVAKKITLPHAVLKNNLSFVLEGLKRQFNALHVLQEVQAFFLTSDASCKYNPASFTVDVTMTEDHCNAILKNEGGQLDNLSKDSSCLHQSSSELCFRISVFQQTPGTLLVKGSLQHKQNPVPGSFSLIFQQLEDVLKHKFAEKTT